MARATLAEAVREQTREALAKGAQGASSTRVAFAASRAGTPYLAPQVLTGVDHAMAMMREESFGPVVGIMKVDSDEEAIRLMNDSALRPDRLDLDRATSKRPKRIGDEIETGTVFMNRCDYLDPALAWTGVKDTGRGATLSRARLRAR